jgi:hypothetical protein
MHFVLMTSPKFATERRRLDSADIEAFPVVPLEKLKSYQRSQIEPLSQRLLDEDSGIFDDIDQFASEIYGLDDLDNEVIRDTLEIDLPYGVSRKRAWFPPTAHERDIFRRRLGKVLKPFFSAIGKTPVVRSCDLLAVGSDAAAPYASFLISKEGTPEPALQEKTQSLILQLGAETGSSQIVQVVKGALLVSILNQYRYWTPTRARLLGTEIVRQHISVFEG